MTMDALLRKACAQCASDLILVAGKPACVYVHGKLSELDDHVLSAEDINSLLTTFTTDEQQRRLAESGDVDFSCGAAEVGRVRVNVHKQRNSYAAALRFIHGEVPSFEELRLPPKLAELARLPRGLVLVTGATGSGKSTTLAAMIEYMNDHFEKHVITLEDPIEFLFRHRRCVIEQREIGEDSPSFADALRHVVRQKPDVILVGEMRDHETISTALTAAETGHLVLGTLHTNSASQTIERIIDVFESGQQPQIRIQLANTLQAVVCQTLLRRADEAGMAPAFEIMLMTPAIRRAIRDSETHLIPGMIETGLKFGMCTLDRTLADLVLSGVITAENARTRAADPDKLERLLGGPRPAAEPPTPKAPAERHERTAEPAGATAAKPWL